MTTTEDVRRRIAELVQQPLDIVEDSVMLADLADSFAIVELAIGLQQSFDVNLMHEDLVRVRTVADLADVIAVRAQGTRT